MRSSSPAPRVSASWRPRVACRRGLAIRRAASPRPRRRPQAPPEAQGRAAGSQAARPRPRRARSGRRAAPQRACDAARAQLRPGPRELAVVQAQARRRAGAGRRRCSPSWCRPRSSGSSQARADLRRRARAGQATSSGRGHRHDHLRSTQDGDPQLLGLSSLLERADPRRPDPAAADGRQPRRRPRDHAPTTTCRPPRCCSRSSEAEVEEAKDEVAVQRQAAAANLVLTPAARADAGRRGARSP